MILDIMILSTFEHVYIVTQRYLIGFSEMNNNLNVLFEILLLSDKLLEAYLATWKSPLLQILQL